MKILEVEKGEPAAVLTGEAGISRMPVQTFERHVTFVDAYRSEARATLVGVTSLVAVAAVDVVAGRSCALSITVTTYDVAQTAQRTTAVRAHEVIHVPA